MSHQPFEQWILDDRSLSADETQLLAKHAENCMDCSKLQEQWKNAAQFLKKAPIYPAPEGFTARWQTSFMARKAHQQKQNGKRFIFFLILGSFTSLLMYLTLTILSGSPIKVFITLLKTSSKLAVGISQINLFLNSIFSYLPPALPIILWILLSCSLVLMLSLWALTFWRYSIKGAVPNENVQ